MGPQAEHIVTTLKLTVEQSKNYDTVIEKLNGYFVPKRNYIAERHSFELRSQRPGESNESYVRALFSLAEHCNFTDADERIRDRLISGMSDRDLSRKIQLKSMEEDVSLNAVISMMRNVEIVNGRDSSGPPDISRVHAPAQHRRQRWAQHPGQQQQQQPPRQQQQQQQRNRQQPPPTAQQRQLSHRADSSSTCMGTVEGLVMCLRETALLKGKDATTVRKWTILLLFAAPKVSAKLKA